MTCPNGFLKIYWMGPARLPEPQTGGGGPASRRSSRTEVHPEDLAASDNRIKANVKAVSYEHCSELLHGQVQKRNPPKVATCKRMRPRMELTVSLRGTQHDFALLRGRQHYRQMQNPMATHPALANRKRHKENMQTAIGRNMTSFVRSQACTHANPDGTKYKHATHSCPRGMQHAQTLA